MTPLPAEVIPPNSAILMGIVLIVAFLLLVMLASALLGEE